MKAKLMVEVHEPGNILISAENASVGTAITDSEDHATLLHTLKELIELELKAIDGLNAERAA
jgi:hypothetical protein